MEHRVQFGVCAPVAWHLMRVVGPVLLGGLAGRARSAPEAKPGRPGADGAATSVEASTFGAGRLVALSEDFETTAAQARALTAPGRHLAPRVRKLIEFLRTDEHTTG